ncbi:transcription termination factor Rho [Williamsia maris]|uniref:Transcription termination factor Rho n=2 Tax=Williamsia maris TaxID=72806 RepID=A0ABT1HBG1_9NOCA|nr:transcription termination factor Rho [Williamsia maris]
MVLTELRQLAGELNIKGTSGMRKGDLIAAIADRQAGAPSTRPTKERATAVADAPSADATVERTSNTAPKADAAPTTARNGAATWADQSAATGADAAATTSRVDTPSTDRPAGDAPATDATTESTEAGGDRTRRRNRDNGGRENNRDGANRDGANRDNGNRDTSTKDNANGAGGQKSDQGRGQGGSDRSESGNRGDNTDGGGRDNNREGGRNNGNRDGNQGNRNGNRENNSNRDNSNRDNNNRDGGGNGNRDNSNRDQQNRDNGPRNNGPRDDDPDGEGNGRGRRGRRFRERRRGRDRDGQDGGGGNNDVSVNEDDVLQPVAGILDVLDNYAFVRTSGYLAGPNDVYVSMNLVRKNGLRRGDALTGAVRLPRDGEQSSQRQKFNPLVRLDSVNGAEVEAARRRPEFNKLTPLYPNERLRLETRPEQLDTRVIDLIMPIGKGQRALIVSPPKAGKTTILQDIANAISINNPECYLMVVLVDERPEEVTDMTRSVKGEVIASTFDRPPSDHTSVSELAIERAKRLVENGKDVVVLLDSITRLGRAYNNASPASGRILSGGVDSTALYPPKRFLGAARNIENGGSLTIIASALVETGSTGDTVIFEEFKGTGNAELKLDRKISERRVFPAVDVNLSSTRKDELMMSPDEFAIVHKLRRVLSGLDSQQAIDLLISQLKKTKTNIEFLMQVQQNTPGTNND